MTAMAADYPAPGSSNDHDSVPEHGATDSVPEHGRHFSAPENVQEDDSSAQELSTFVDEDEIEVGPNTVYFGIIEDPDYFDIGSDDYVAGMHVNLDADDSSDMELESGLGDEPPPLVDSPQPFGEPSPPPPPAQMQSWSDGVPPPPPGISEPPQTEAVLTSDSTILVFKYGKYKGMTMQEVTENHFDYYLWASKQKKPGKFLENYVNWVR